MLNLNWIDFVIFLLIKIGELGFIKSGSWVESEVAGFYVFSTVSFLAPFGGPNFLTLWNILYKNP